MHRHIHMHINIQPLTLNHTFTHTFTYTQAHTHPGLDSRAGEAGDRGRCLFSSPSSPSLTTSKDFSESVKARLIAARAVRAVFKNRRRERRGSHFQITFPPSVETERKTPQRQGNERRAGMCRWQEGGVERCRYWEGKLDVYWIFDCA